MVAELSGYITSNKGFLKKDLSSIKVLAIRTEREREEIMGKNWEKNWALIKSQNKNK